MLHFFQHIFSCDGSFEYLGKPTCAIYLVRLIYIYPGPLDHVSKQICVPKPKLNFGKHAFSIAAPTICNQLHITVKSFESTPGQILVE